MDKRLQKFFDTPALREAIRRAKEITDEHNFFRRTISSKLSKIFGPVRKTKILSEEGDGKSEIPKIEIIETLIVINI